MNVALGTEMSDLQKRTTLTGAIKQYGQRLLGFIRGKVKTLEDAEDVLQDVWFQFSNLANVDEIESLSGWLYSVARNRITDFYRKKKTASLEDMSYEDEDGQITIKDILLLDTGDNPDLILFKELFWKELNKALAELPENQRLVFVENEIEDKTLQQIASEQGENLKTIISRKTYAVKYLRQQLEPLYKELQL